MASAFPYCERAFVWMVTERALVDGIYTGLAICFPVAFCVLVFATGSFTISAFAILSIMLTLLVFVGEAVRDALDPRLVK